MIEKEELGNKIQENRGKESRKKFSERTGIPEDSLKAWERGINYPSLQNCELLKDEFGYDWNTFLSVPYEKEVAKTQQDADVCKLTGLSETAIKKLTEWKRSDDMKRHWASFLSFMLEHESCEEILKHISNIMGLSKIERLLFQDDSSGTEIMETIDMQVAHSYYIMTLFQRVIDDMSYKERMKE